MEFDFHEFMKGLISHNSEHTAITKYAANATIGTTDFID